MSRLFQKALLPLTPTLFRYGVVGVIGTVLYLSVLAVAVHVLEVDPLPGSVVSFVIVLFASYGLHYFWGFRSSRKHSYALSRFLLVSVLGLVLNVGIMYFTVDILRWGYLWGAVLVIALVPSSNFLLNSSWSFRESRDHRVRGDV